MAAACRHNCQLHVVRHTAVELQHLVLLHCAHARWLVSVVVVRQAQLACTHSGLGTGVEGEDGAIIMTSAG